MKLIPTSATVLLMLAGLLGAFQAKAQVPEGDTQHIRQDFTRPRINLWEDGKMPNSKGLDLPDSIYNERTWRIMTPRIYSYTVSPENNTHTAVLVIPGGGYAKQAYEGAGEGNARWLNSLGITAFMLIHRLPNSPDAEDGTILSLQDAQRAIRYIRAHAKEYDIDPDRIGVMGASSGGHVSACVCTVNEDVSAVGDELDSYSFKPDFAILISPVISMDDPIANRGSRSTLLGSRWQDKELRDKWSMDKQVTPANPPMFFVHAADDTSVPPQNSLRMFNALLENGVIESTVHVFPHGKHSIGVQGMPGSTSTWPEAAIKWMKEIGKLQE